MPALDSSILTSVPSPSPVLIEPRRGRLAIGDDAAAATAAPHRRKRAVVVATLPLSKPRSPRRRQRRRRAAAAFGPLHLQSPPRRSRPIAVLRRSPPPRSRPSCRRESNRLPRGNLRRTLRSTRARPPRRPTPRRLISAAALRRQSRAAATASTAAVTPAAATATPLPEAPRDLSAGVPRASRRPTSAPTRRAATGDGDGTRAATGTRRSFYGRRVRRSDIGTWIKRAKHHRAPAPSFVRRYRPTGSTASRPARRRRGGEGGEARSVSEHGAGSAGDGKVAATIKLEINGRVCDDRRTALTSSHHRDAVLRRRRGIFVAAACSLIDAPPSVGRRPLGVVVVVAAFGDGGGGAVASADVKTHGLLLRRRAPAPSGPPRRGSGRPLTSPGRGRRVGADIAPATTRGLLSGSRPPRTTVLAQSAAASPQEAGGTRRVEHRAQCGAAARSRGRGAPPALDGSDSFADLAERRRQLGGRRELAALDLRGGGGCGRTDLEGVDRLERRHCSAHGRRRSAPSAMIGLACIDATCARAARGRSARRAARRKSRWPGGGICTPGARGSFRWMYGGGVCSSPSILSRAVGLQRLRAPRRDLAGRRRSRRRRLDAQRGVVVVDRRILVHPPRSCTSITSTFSLAGFLHNCT